MPAGPISDRDAVEVFHIAFLAGLGAAPDKRPLVVKGGANLRFFFGSPRRVLAARRACSLPCRGVVFATDALALPDVSRALLMVGVAPEEAFALSRVRFGFRFVPHPGANALLLFLLRSQFAGVGGRPARLQPVFRTRHGFTTYYRMNRGGVELGSVSGLVVPRLARCQSFGFFGSLNERSTMS